MKKVVFNKHGGIEVLEFTEASLPEPAPGEARLKVITSGISWADVMARRGQYFGENNKTPKTPGYDVVGIVDKVGDGVASVRVGQRMAAILFKMGGNSEYVCIPQQFLVTVPEALDSAEATAVILNGLTAYASLHRALKVKAGEKIFVTNAAGGVGTMAVQLAKLAGLEVYGSASTGKLSLVKELGAAPIDYKTEDVITRVRELSGGGVDVVMDMAGNNEINLFDALSDKGGRILMVGAVAFVGMNPRTMFKKFVGSYARSFFSRKEKFAFFGDLPTIATKDPQWYRQTLSELFNLVVNGKLKVVIGKRLPMQEIAQGHHMLESSAVSGKIILEAQRN
ncbi:MAG: zinc-binding dehydrogenase [Chloroflexi bacterium]|nr:zinc-binding dehydrogenase [Ardenticatenaceae bacterium]MBL1131470.1 oxidoreductase [Chloroflexota bacterium]NOG37580.1 zinc-binding dehydrogenase [Chloroflexota bacterium]